MNETIIHLKPQEQWRAGMTREKLITEMDEKLRMPGVTNIWTQPIINRIEMLSTGIRTQVGIKIFGNDLKELEELSRQVADAVRNIPGAADVYPEQIGGSPYIDIKIDRPVGGPIRHRCRRYPGNDRKRYRRNESDRHDRRTTAISGPRALRVRVSRYAGGSRARYRSRCAERRHDPALAGGKYQSVEGPTMIQSENGLLRGTVLLNVRGRDVGSFVDEAKHAVAEKIQLPAGYYIAWSGQYENQQRAPQPPAASRADRAARDLRSALSDL